ncbi:hypothetical protein BJ165DRAFT_1516034 [Panaeolus papilionaceus]|nr:hypothetical protein BJ165DRAFT_1516034 [Panaeolus papilionaceus]
MAPVASFSVLHQRRSPADYPLDQHHPLHLELFKSPLCAHSRCEPAAALALHWTECKRVFEAPQVSLSEWQINWIGMTSCLPASWSISKFQLERMFIYIPVLNSLIQPGLYHTSRHFEAEQLRVSTPMTSYTSAFRTLVKCTEKSVCHILTGNA